MQELPLKMEQLYPESCRSEQADGFFLKTTKGDDKDCCTLGQ